MHVGKNPDGISKKFLQNCRKHFIVLWLFFLTRVWTSPTFHEFGSTMRQKCGRMNLPKSHSPKPCYTVTCSHGESHPKVSAFDTHHEQCNLHSLQHLLSTFYKASRCSVSSSWVCTRSAALSCRSRMFWQLVIIHTRWMECESVTAPLKCGITKAV